MLEERLIRRRRQGLQSCQGECSPSEGEGCVERPAVVKEGVVMGTQGGSPMARAAGPGSLPPPESPGTPQGGGH